MRLEELVSINHGTILARVKDPLKDRNNKMKMLSLQNLGYALGTNIEQKTQYEYIDPDKIHKCIFGKLGEVAIGLTFTNAMVIEKDNENALIPSNFALMAFNSDLINPYYLMWFLNESNGFRKQVGVLTQGTTVRSLQIRQLREIKISLPSIEEQNKIGTFYKLLLRKEKLLQEQKRNYLDYIRGSYNMKEEK